MNEDERPDPAEALMEGIIEAFRPLARQVSAFIDAWNRAGAMWLEQNRPLIEALGRLAADPRVRAYAEAYERGEIPPEPQPCHCLCGKTHPADKGICDMNAVTTRHFDTERLGPVDVPLCAPCAVAQGIAELA